MAGGCRAPAGGGVAVMRLTGQIILGSSAMGTILLVILILLLIGALPAWPHSRAWGYGPTGGIGLIVVILLILVLLGKI